MVSGLTVILFLDYVNLMEVLIINTICIVYHKLFIVIYCLYLLEDCVSYVKYENMC